MNGELSLNAQAILLLTAPLLAGKAKRSVKPLSLGEYQGLARHLHHTGRKPADLLEGGALNELDDYRRRLEIERLHRLLQRGFLLAQALERWRARGIWVVTRADSDYPRRLKQRMRAKAPPVLYGCGERGGLDDGGLAVVGSRDVNDDLIRYTEDVGRLAAEADIAIVSGGARGVDQAAMRGALESGGRSVGVLANGLERAALHRDNRQPLMDGRLALVSPYDPAVRFLAGYAMERNKHIYALADAALVVNSDHGHGGTWKGATDQLGKLHFVQVYVRRCGDPSEGLDALRKQGAGDWPDPGTPDALRQIVSSDALRTQTAAASAGKEDQLKLSLAERTDVVPAAVREHTAAAHEGRAPESPRFSLDDVPPRAVKAGKRLLPEMSGEMTVQDILAALGLKHRGSLQKRYLKPCLAEDWIERIPNRPPSREHRFRLTSEGRRCRELLSAVSPSTPGQVGAGAGC